MRLEANRPGLGTARMPVDMLDGSGVQVHNANQRTCQKLFLHTGCSTECHGQLGNSWGGQTLQILVSLGAQEGGKVSLAKIES